jgi:hypothetical protein
MIRSPYLDSDKMQQPWPGAKALSVEVLALTSKIGPPRNRRIAGMGPAKASNPRMANLSFTFRLRARTAPSGAGPRPSAREEISA